MCHGECGPVHEGGVDDIVDVTMPDVVLKSEGRTQDGLQDVSKGGREDGNEIGGEVEVIKYQNLVCHGFNERREQRGHGFRCR